jgi:hypothetical protein
VGYPSVLASEALRGNEVSGGSREEIGHTDHHKNAGLGPEDHLDQTHSDDDPVDTFDLDAVAEMGPGSG